MTFNGYNVRMRALLFRLLTTLVLGVALLGLSGSSAWATFPGTNGLIAFERGGDIYTVTTDSAHTVALLVSGAIDPAWSADGSKLAVSQGGSIKVFTVAGSTMGAALDTGTSPAFSPDGTMIAYQKGTDIWVVSSSGGTPRNLTNSGAATDDAPSWSPDGTKIAFARSFPAVNADIYVMDAPTGGNTGGGTNQEQLTTATSNETEPAWSPAGNRIVYSSDRNGAAQRQLYSIGSAGGTETRITNSSGDDVQPVYSPDQTLFAFARTGSGIYSLGSGETRLTTGATDLNPDWRPAPPSNTTLPIISGNTAEGGILFASTGNFTSASSYAYQWLRCDSDGNNCVDISGATGSSYTLKSSEVGKRVRVRVTGSSSSGSASATSEATAVIQGPEPKNTVPPRVIVLGTTGAPAVGVTLSSSVGTWTGSGFLTYTYQWKKCMPKDGPCYEIPLATNATFVPTVDLIGWSLRVEVTAKNASASTTAQSESTPAVFAAPPVNVVRPQISVSRVPPTVGQSLSVDTGTWTGLVPITFAFQWKRCDLQGTLASCLAIPGAVTPAYTVLEVDRTATLRVYVTARNAAGTSEAFSDHTFPAIPAPRFAPSVSAAPTLTGEAKLGETLTATRGSWSGFAPIRYTTVWQRCDATLRVCRSVKGLKGLTYPITKADLGFRIRLAVVARNELGTVRANTDATEPIVLGPPKPKGRRLVGTAKANYLPGGGGDDVLLGLGGPDTLMGGAGDDRLDGGTGNDYLDGGKGRDRLAGGGGSDTIVAADGAIDQISCGAGNDRVLADPTDVISPDCEVVSFPAQKEPETPGTTGKTTTGTTAGTTTTSGPTTTFLKD